MCLFIDEDKTAELKKSHPRFRRCWKKLVPIDEVLNTPFQNIQWDSDGWQRADGDVRVFLFKEVIERCLKDDRDQFHPQAIKEAYENQDSFVIEGGSIHVYGDDSAKGRHLLATDMLYGSMWLPVYGLRQDFQAIGLDGDDYESLCYTKVYLPKAAWRKYVIPWQQKAGIEKAVESPYQMLKWRNTYKATANA